MQTLFREISLSEHLEASAKAVWCANLQIVDHDTLIRQSGLSDRYIVERMQFKGWMPIYDHRDPSRVKCWELAIKKDETI